VLADVRSLAELRALPVEALPEICRELRTRSDVPVVMLTALGEEVDRIVGLEVGADDYLGKPFDLRELLARVKSVLRRGAKGGKKAKAIASGT